MIEYTGMYHRSMYEIYGAHVWLLGTDKEIVASATWCVINFEAITPHTLKFLNSVV